MNLFERFPKNPILKPNKEESWESKAVFNGCPIKKGKKIYLLYRALSPPHYHASINYLIKISDIGIAESDDGLNFTKRKKFIVPEEEWEKYGCEDPRVTKFNGQYYIFYTALSRYPFTSEGIKIGLAISQDLKKIKEKHLVTPFNAKGMALFPEKINGKIYALLTVNTDRPPAKIALASFEKEEEIWSEKFWLSWYQKLENYSLPLQRRKEDHLEVGTPPIKTKYGWLLFYSYIRNYFSEKRLFTIEAILLDLKNPFKIIGRSDYPLLVPEEEYEIYGMTPQVVFPSGALIQKDEIWLYYGAADTTIALAKAKLSNLIQILIKPKDLSLKFTRVPENPIITPIKNHFWESKATFNPGAIFLKDRIHIIYRAMAEDNTSYLGYASTKDGFHIDERLPEPIYVPREDFEKKLVPGNNSGCEDPRLTLIDNKIYLFYTAFDGKNPPRIAVSSISVDNFLNKKWNWEKPVLISPPEFDNKDACLFPEKVKGKYLIFHRFGESIDIALLDHLNFDGKTWLEETIWLLPRKGFWDSLKVGIAAPPLKTKIGWILFYHGVSEEDHYYRVGALLLDLKNPLKILKRTIEPILEPEMPYEKEGQVKNVVFPCGAVLLGKKVFLYYGGGDSVCCLATIDLDFLLSKLKEI